MSLDALYYRIISPRRKFYHVPLHLLFRVASIFYRLGLYLNRLAYRSGIFSTRSLSGRVISVGNLTLGGTGKTPVVIMIAEILRDQGLKPAILSRGYGGDSNEKVNVVSDGKKLLLSADQAGDEPVMIARRLKNIPVLTGKDRFLTGKHALEHFGVDTLILDDGYQHLGLARDLNILLLDQRKPLGNGHLFPAGELREPVKASKRADMICFTRCKGNENFDLQTGRPKLPVNITVTQTELRLKSFTRLDNQETISKAVLKGQPVAAFCGIANPSDFCDTLKTAGAQVVFFRAFPDHHRYGTDDLKTVEQEAKKAGAQYIVVSEKDSVKIDPSDFSLPVLKMIVDVEILAGREVFTKLLLEK
jgi:tetraacyldisaccharide 4'-kinase